MRHLSTIPNFATITERDGRITTFFRLLWDAIRTGWSQVPLQVTASKTGQTAAIDTTSLLTVASQGLYRVSWYLRKTTADGVSSSLQITIGWTESAAALTLSGAALTADETTTPQTGSFVVQADADSDLTYAVAYSSGTDGTMTYEVVVSVEALVN